MTEANERPGDAAISLAFGSGMLTVVGLLCLLPLVMDYPIAAAVTLGIPLTLGALAGLVARRAAVFVMFALVLGGVCATVGALWLEDLAGVFCGCVYFVAAIPPAVMAGAVVVVLRRRAAARRPGAKPGALWFLLALTPPFALHAWDRLQGPYAEEALEASRDLDAPAEAVWERSLAFPPGAAWPWETMHAPLPRDGAGHATAVGDEKVIRFDKGVVQTRVVAVQAPHRLVAEVVAQDVERRALRLHRVILRCEPLGPDRTRCTVRIEFEPRMGPRWYWRLYEGFFGAMTLEAVLAAWQSGTASTGTATAPGR